MKFTTKVAGIPCQCEVISYRPSVPGKFTGPFEDCYPDEPAEFEYQILTMRGKPAAWLQKKVTDGDDERLQMEYEAFVTANKYGKDF